MRLVPRAESAKRIASVLKSIPSSNELLGNIPPDGNLNSPQSTRVWVVTTIFQRPENLGAYLRCLDRQSHRRFHLILVDHGVEPSLNAEVKRSYMTILRESSDKWWTEAVNAGIRHVLSLSEVEDRDLIVLQNDDSAFGESFLDGLVRASCSRRVVGSVAIDRDTDTILHASLKFDHLRARYKYLNYGRKLDELDQEVFDSDVLKGRGVAYPVSIVRQIGLLDERLKQYKSDHEWAFRARRLGFPVIVSKAVSTHAVIDTQEKVVESAPFRSLWRVFFDRRSPRNIPDTIRYYYICFNPFLATYCALVDIGRTILFCTAKTCLILLEKTGR